MIVRPLEEHEAARWLRYQKDIVEASAPVKKLIEEFQAWADGLTVKYGKDFPEENINRITDDGKYVISFDIEKLLGKK
jgi:hypothetical protein